MFRTWLRSALRKLSCLAEQDGGRHARRAGRRRDGVRRPRQTPPRRSATRFAEHDDSWSSWTKEGMFGTSMAKDRRRASSQAASSQAASSQAPSSQAPSSQAPPPRGSHGDGGASSRIPTAQRRSTYRPMVSRAAARPSAGPAVGGRVPTRAPVIVSPAPCTRRRSQVAVVQQARVDDKAQQQSDGWTTQTTRPPSQAGTARACDAYGTALPTAAIGTWATPRPPAPNKRTPCRASSYAPQPAPAAAKAASRSNSCGEARMALPTARPGRMDRAIVCEVVDALGKLFPHMPYAVCGQAALVYYGQTRREPDHVSVVCPTESAAVLVSWARSKGLPPSTRFPLAFGLTTCDAVERCVHVVSFADFRSLHRIRRGPAAASIVTLPCLANTLARDYMQALVEDDSRGAVQRATDIFWLMHRIVDDGAAEQRLSPATAGFFAHPDFLAPFIHTYSRAAPLMQKAGLDLASVPRLRLPEPIRPSVHLPPRQDAPTMRKLCGSSAGRLARFVRFVRAAVRFQRMARHRQKARACHRCGHQRPASSMIPRYARQRPLRRSKTDARPSTQSMEPILGPSLGKTLSSVREKHGHDST